MRERGQASVETTALIAVALAIATALLLGVARFAPPYAASLVRALSGVVAPSEQLAPGLDDLEAALVAGATGAGSDGPTLLDVRTHLRSRLGRSAGDAVFARTLRLLVEQALPPDAAGLALAGISITGQALEIAYLRGRLHPDLWTRGATTLVGSAGPVGGAWSLLDSLGVLGGDEPGGLAPGAAAGDVTVALAHRRVLVLRRLEGAGLAVVGDRTTPARFGPA